MIKHIVFWRLAEPVDGASAAGNALEMKRRLEGLNGRIPGLLALEVGVDFGHTDASSDVALYSEFTDREALASYAVHPEHVAIGAFVGQVTRERSVIDYECS